MPQGPMSKLRELRRSYTRHAGPSKTSPPIMDNDNLDTWTTGKQQNVKLVPDTGTAAALSSR
jgi:hypothetical protein